MTGGRSAQLLASCVVLGLGVVLLLRSALGSDGYSTFVTGLSRSSGWDFALSNTLVGVTLVGLAWWRGTRPGPGTLAQTVVVGLTVSGGLALTAEPSSLRLRALLLALALPVLAVGVAGYLNTESGAGPAEAAALAVDPPVPFRWGYNLLQGTGALVGWLLGADVGPGTVLVVVALGPAVAALRIRLPHWETPATV
jgi:uncharacterized membrane protein YczE